MKETPVPKRPYATPRLVVYGDLRVITENKMSSGSDGGSGNNTFSK
jgi:hypothetical protein